MMKQWRLDRLLCNLGYTTRSEVGVWCKKNGVTIMSGNESKPVNTSQMVDQNQIRIKGEKLPFTLPVTIVLHKPDGCLASNEKDEHNPKTIFDLLPVQLTRAKPILSIAGRLDKFATGLMVVSQDGQLVNRIISPYVPQYSPLAKVYEVEALHPFTGKEGEVFASGTLQLRSEPTPLKPAQFEVIDPSRNLARITLFEGRYHQIIRMIAAVGNRVKSIHRQSIGPVKLANLASGQWRVLSELEHELLMKKSGVNTRVK